MLFALDFSWTLFLGDLMWVVSTASVLYLFVTIVIGLIRIVCAASVSFLVVLPYLTILMISIVSCETVFCLNCWLLLLLLSRSEQISARGDFIAYHFGRAIELVSLGRRRFGLGFLAVHSYSVNFYSLITFKIECV